MRHNPAMMTEAQINEAIRLIRINIALYERLPAPQEHEIAMYRNCMAIHWTLMDVLTENNLPTPPYA